MEIFRLLQKSLIQNIDILSMVRGLQSQFNQFCIFPVFQNNKSIGYILIITFLFGICPHSLAVVIAAKFECDLNKLSDTFMRLNISPVECITNWALVTPRMDYSGKMTKKTLYPRLKCRTLTKLDCNTTVCIPVKTSIIITYMHI